MISRRTFMTQLSCSLLFAKTVLSESGKPSERFPYPGKYISRFCKELQPVGRVLELKETYVWCNSPTLGPDGKIHLFFSRWPAKYGMGGWIHKCEIARAVADSPEGPYHVAETVLAPRGEGYWDGTTCHNPHIQVVDGKYCLFYMGNSNGKTHTKRIGLAIADSPEGPWHRPDEPLLDPGPEGAWDDHCTTNPAFIKHPNGQYWLYYKSWNTAEHEAARGKSIRGNRKYGLAIADSLQGPYIKHPDNPLIDFSGGKANEQLEDAYVWIEKGHIKLIARDMGFFDHNVGLIFESRDGIHWPQPEIAYFAADHYIDQPPAPPHLKRYNRFERPQLLMQDGKPTHLFTTSQGGTYMTATPFIFKIL
ncbi:family 43 glycosylhydrolase [candidate division KSB1 bacterium]|nr:family 43 glycosylhydrolase [candidate division KSB1 bacterium]